LLLLPIALKEMLSSHSPSPTTAQATQAELLDEKHDGVGVKNAGRDAARGWVNATHWLDGQGHVRQC
jgi:hypothetical protein